jgi:hypothetical protein
VSYRGATLRLKNINKLRVRDQMTHPVVTFSNFDHAKALHALHPGGAYPNSLFIGLKGGHRPRELYTFIMNYIIIDLRLSASFWNSPPKAAAPMTSTTAASACDPTKASPTREQA